MVSNTNYEAQTQITKKFMTDDSPFPEESDNLAILHVKPTDEEESF